MSLIRDLLHRVTHFLSHLLRQHDRVILLEHIRDAALAGLAVDADDVRIVGSRDVLRIDGQIRHGPLVGIVDLFVSHSLGDRILVGTGESAEYEVSRVRLPCVDLHPGQALIGLADPGHVCEVKLRIDAVCKQVHSYRDNIHIAGSLAVSEQRAFHAVRARKDAELRVRDAAPAVVVGVETEHYAVSVFHILIQILDLGGKNVRHSCLYRCGNVDDSLPLGRRLPYVQHRVADFERVLHFRAVEALRAVLEHKVAVRLICQFLKELRAVDCEFLDLLLVLFKDLLALGHGR